MTKSTRVFLFRLFVLLGLLTVLTHSLVKPTIPRPLAMIGSTTAVGPDAGPAVVTSAAYVTESEIRTHDWGYNRNIELIVPNDLWEPRNITWHPKPWISIHLTYQTTPHMIVIETRTPLGIELRHPEGEW